MGKAITIILILVFAQAGAAEDCASTYADLGKTENLKSLQSLFHGETWLGLVNETQGTYIMLLAKKNRIEMNLYSSGLFSILPLHREGPVVFCDDGRSLVFKSLGRTEPISIQGGKLIMGDGEPKRSFSEGAMPDALKKLHHLDTRGIASEGRR